MSISPNQDTVQSMEMQEFHYINAISPNEQFQDVGLEGLIAVELEEIIKAKVLCAIMTIKAPNFIFRNRKLLKVTEDGTGCLINLNIFGTSVYTLCTCNHVIGLLNMLEEVHLNFPTLPKLKNLKLNKTDFINNLCWTDKIIDATVLVMTKSFAKMLISKGARFLKSGAPKVGDHVEFYQCPNGKLSHTNGQIEYILKENLLYYMNADYGSSGSPLVNLAMEVVGIHKRFETGTEEANKHPHKIIRTASNIKVIRCAMEYYLLSNLQK